jgi:hypothetical protein
MSDPSWAQSLPQFFEAVPIEWNARLAPVPGPGIAASPAMRSSMLSIWLALTFGVGCGSTLVGANGGGGRDGGGGQAGAPAGQGSQSDGGEIACGDTRCQSSEICLYPPYGCISVGPSDADVCPAGWDYSDATADCVQPPPAPSCVRLTPGEGSFDCSGGDAGAGCGAVNAPIPSDCGRICRSICI